MTVTGLDPTVALVLDLAGVLVFALSGASLVYAIPATLGAAATAAAWSQDALAAPQAVSIAAAVLALRLLAMRNDWRAPTARQGPEHSR